MTQAKQGLIKALDQLDDSPYQELKATLTQRVEDLHTNIKALQAQVSPYTDSFVSTISESTADLRNSIAQDIEALRADLEPKRAK
ncbi:hypothetical protein, partial [Pseudomonas baetica]